MGWYLFGICGLSVSGLLTVCLQRSAGTPSNKSRKSGTKTSTEAAMTAEEITTSVRTATLEILASPDSEGMNLVDLMNKAGMTCFTLGVRASNSMHEGALAVLKARISK